MHFNELITTYARERLERDYFHDLMRMRVREILLVASLYDSFILESDGALSEQIYGEFYRLNLSMVPRVSCAYSSENALEMFSTGTFDMVILMAGLDYDGPLELAEKMKFLWPKVPILLLAMNNSSLAGLYKSKNSLCTDYIDRVFVWNGYSKLFVGMIKYVEDLHNVDNDTRVGMVRVILLIEDSVRYYSRYLPLLYSVVMKQTQLLVEEERSFETYKILRMRGRPKVLLATSYEEAKILYDRYEPYLLTVISDVRFSKEGSDNSEAGFHFLSMARNRKPDLPVLIQSSEADNRQKAYALGASFTDKNSSLLTKELVYFFQSQLGFGPFVFRNPDGDELGLARNMAEFEEKIMTVSAESLLYHANRNHFSAWLMARGELRFARIIRNYSSDDFSGPAELRDFLCRTIDELRRNKTKGMIPAIDTYSQDRGLCRLGGGSIGGKGRGLAFIKSLIDNQAFPPGRSGIEVRLPYTAFIGIDEFEKFMDQHNLWGFSWYAAPDSELRKAFLARPLDHTLLSRLKSFLLTSNKPLAVRSSGLFEDMLMVPFSGVYETYIIPNDSPSIDLRLQQLSDAIRLIYASLYSESSRTYFEAASYKIDEERMAIVVQELVGQRFGNWYYPLIAGTAQSYNYYPVSYIKPDDGLCIAGLGLGAYVVEGGEAYRFCPRYPKLDVVAPGEDSGSVQKWFYALDMDKQAPDLAQGDKATLAKLDLAEAEANPWFSLIVSTWNFADDRLEAGSAIKGPRLIDFAPILKHEAFPLATVINTVLDTGSRSMGIPVEIEFALSFDEDQKQPIFYVLQIKPLIQQANRGDIDINEIKPGQFLVFSEKSMGNGRDNTIKDVIWVDPDNFDRSKTDAMAEEIGLLNEELKELERRYILIGPGRWGTRDRWLGIPVTFSQISSAKAIVEADLSDFRVESSLGSHFFHNVTSMNISYMSVPWNSDKPGLDWDWLKSKKPVKRGKYCVWTSFDEAFTILMDGRKSRSIILKPGM